MKSLLTLFLSVLVVTACSTENQPYDLFLISVPSIAVMPIPDSLTLEPEGNEMLTGTEMLIVHFRECDETQLKVPFHIELEEDEDWDRSRTWIFTRHDDGLELRHDYRNHDGSNEDVTMYGGFSVGEGTAMRQEFQSVERTEETGIFRGWRIEIVPGDRYSYGTIREVEWSWRVDFDLSEPLDEVPPAPWGHEQD